MDNMVPKNILLRLSNDDEKAFEFIIGNIMLMSTILQIRCCTHLK